MNLKEFTSYLRHVPNHPSCEIVKRAYKNASGIDEIIILNQGYWDYIEWLEENTGDIDFAEWVVHCGTYPTEGYTLSHQLMYWLWFDQCNRFRAGLPTPYPYPPLGYEGWGDEPKIQHIDI